MTAWPWRGERLADEEAGEAPAEDFERLVASLSDGDRVFLLRVFERIAHIAADEGEPAAELKLREIVEIIEESRPARTSSRRC